MPGCVEARRYRKNERDQDSERGKARAGSNNRDNNTCQHIFSFYLPACRKRPLSIGVPQADLMLFFNGFLRERGQASEHAETAPSGSV